MADRVVAPDRPALRERLARERADGCASESRPWCCTKAAIRKARELERGRADGRRWRESGQQRCQPSPGMTQGAESRARERPGPAAVRGGMAWRRRVRSHTRETMRRLLCCFVGALTKPTPRARVLAGWPSYARRCAEIDAAKPRAGSWSGCGSGKGWNLTLFLLLTSHTSPITTLALHSSQRRWM